jgi:hypothetical protein
MRRWAACGAMALTGDADGPPLAPSTGAALVANGLLGERAALAGLSRQGTTSCGGSARLLPAGDGWVAVSLPRADDVALLPALFGDAMDDVGWDAVASQVASRGVDELVDQAALLGLAVAGVGRATGPFEAHQRSEGTAPPTIEGLLVLDLTALWAGPLCTHLLASAGARVVKVESRTRPDGARQGNEAFYRLLNAGKESVAVDLDDERDRALLRELSARADVVVTSSRARAVEKLGLDVDRVKVWTAITAYGWDDNRIGFGDDVAAGAGLVAWDPTDGRPRFAADAIADPLCGLAAAEATVDAIRAGGRWFVDASLCGAVLRAGVSDSPARAAERTDEGWVIDGEVVRQPEAHPSTGEARPLGADTERVRAEVTA